MRDSKDARILRGEISELRELWVWEDSEHARILKLRGFSNPTILTSITYHDTVPITRRAEGNRPL